MRNRTGLCHENYVTEDDGQTGWDDIVERFYHTYLSTKRDG